LLIKVGSPHPIKEIKNLRRAPGVVMHACNTSYARGRGRKIECSRPVWGKVSEALSQKIPTKGLGAGDVAQVVELKYETLGSTPSTAKNNNNNKF
jgi:hypothetical protein